MSTISFSSSPCLLYVFLFLLSSSGSKPKTEERFYCFLSCLFPGALHTYLFTLEGQLPRLKFIWVPLYFFLFLLGSCIRCWYNLKKWKLFHVQSFWIDFSDLYEMRCLQVVEASPLLAFYSSCATLPFLRTISLMSVAFSDCTYFHTFSPQKVTLCLCSTILHNANKPLYSLHFLENVSYVCHCSL